MKRTQIQLPEDLYEWLRNKAHRHNKSMAQVVREALREQIEGEDVSTSKTLEDFKFVGCGGSNQEGFSPVSKRHDEVLGNSIR